MNRRQALAGISAASVALIITPKRSLALECFSPVTYKQAKALGMKFRALKTGGPNSAWVEVKFDLKGELEGIKRVTLRTNDGDKLLVSATLSNEADADGQYKVTFLADRDLLKKSELWFSSGFGGASVGGAYVLKVFDVDEVKALR